MKNIILIITTFILASTSIYSFEIIEKKFKNSIQFDFSLKSGGSYNDINAKNQTELTRFVDSIRYSNGQLSPISYIFERKDQLYNLSAKYFIIEPLAINAKINSTLLSMTQREFFYFGVDEFLIDQKIAYDLEDKNEFILNDYQFGIEYYFLREKVIAAFTGYYSLSGINENVNYSPLDSTDLNRIQNHVTKADSILIYSDDFSFATPNIISFGGLFGYRFTSSYLELASNYELRTNEFKDQVVSHLAIELNNNDIFKIKGKLQYIDIIGDFDETIPYRPFRSNPQAENLNLTVGLSYIKDNIFAELNYGQTLYAKNSLNWGIVNFSLAYIF